MVLKIRMVFVCRGGETMTENSTKTLLVSVTVPFLWMLVRGAFTL